VPIFGRKGCSIHAQEILGALVRRGARVELFSTSVEGRPPPGLETLRVHGLPRPPKSGVAEREQAALAGNEGLRLELQAAGSFDFIYERYSLWSYAAMEYACEAGIPGLLEVNAPLIDEQAQYRVLVDRAGAERVAHRVFGAARALLAVSDEVAAWLERFPTARGKVQVVPNGIRAERFPSDLAATCRAADGVFTVGFVGTLKAWHGLSVLVDAFARLHAVHPDTRLLVVGDGPEREKLEADLESRGLSPATVLTGAVDPAQVPGLLASMDVAVAPYPAMANFYFSPLKVYEYMAAGLPVVASRIGQLQKLIEPGFTGLLVPPGDATSLTTALDHLRRNPEVGKSMGRRARATVFRRSTWDSVLQRIFHLAGLALPAETVASSVA
jgi:glycosyltransferase involved in cell wall biosynthesis